MVLLSLGVFVNAHDGMVYRMYEGNKIKSIYTWVDDHTTILVDNWILVDSFVTDDIFGKKAMYNFYIHLEYKYKTNIPPKNYNLVNVCFYLRGDYRPNETVMSYIKYSKRVVFFLDDSVRLSYTDTRKDYDKHFYGSYHSSDISMGDLKKIVYSNKIKFMFCGSFREYTLSEDAKENIRKFFEVIEN